MVIFGKKDEASVHVPAQTEPQTVTIRDRQVTIVHHHPAFREEEEALRRREEINDELYRLLAQYVREEKTGKQD